MDKVERSVLDVSLEELNDVPSYAGSQNKTLAVKNDETGMEFVQIRDANTVYDNASFANLFEKNGDTIYEIKTAYKSVIFQINSDGGGYDVADLLEGDDTWGDLYTNDCGKIKFEPGAYINFDAMKGHLTVDTNGCHLIRVDIRGSGSVGGIVDSYLLDAERVTFDACRCSNRNSNIDMVGFQGSATALDNTTSKYSNCEAYQLDGSDKIYGFKDCMNLFNCLSYDIESTGDFIYGFRLCSQLSNCVCYKLDSSSRVYGFNYCNQLLSCYISDLDSNGSNVRGYSNCNQLSGCKCEDIDSAGSTCYGFEYCDNISACYCYDLDSSVSHAYGFASCDQISGCKAEKIDYSGAGVFNAYGFINCLHISACYAADIDVGGAGSAEGFSYCNYGSSLYTNEALNGNNNWIDTVDPQIVNKVSTPNVWT